VPASAFLYRPARGLRLDVDRSSPRASTAAPANRPRQPFAMRGVGPLWLKSLNKPLFRALMRLQGIAEPAAVPNDDLDAYVDLLRRGDGGAAFLKIMRRFEVTRAKRDLYIGTLGRGPFPAQVVWGERDPASRPSRPCLRRRPSPATPGRRPRRPSPTPDPATSATPNRSWRGDNLSSAAAPPRRPAPVSMTAVPGSRGMRSDLSRRAPVGAAADRASDHSGLW
jgi:hypothetical protein